MKKVMVLFMLLFLFIQSTSQLWIAVSFFANRDYIAKVLCINRDKPKMGCNGACQLKKNLKKDKESQEQSGIDTKGQEVLLYLPVVIHTAQSNVIFDWTEKTFEKFHYTSFLREGFPNSIFHPPATIV